MRARLTLLALGIAAAGLVSLGLAQEPDGGTPASPKNVIFLIGDGMGPQQMALLFDWSDAAGEGETALQRLGNDGTIGMLRTGAVGSPVTDSAAAATALATGVSTANGFISVDPQGRRLATCLEDAEKSGRVTGLVSSTRITHATPACFASHVRNRGFEPEIARQLVEESGVEVLLGGGGKVFAGKLSHGGKLLREQASESGYTVLTTGEELGRFERGSGKVLGLFSGSHLPYVLDRDEPGEQVAPTLTKLTEKALELLSGTDEGFFLMVEGGRIDHAGHANDVAGVLGEMREFDATVALVMEYQRKHPDTLVVVTADHETGGLCVGYGRRKSVAQDFVAMGEVQHTVSRVPDSEVVNATDAAQFGFGRGQFYPAKQYWTGNATALTRSGKWNVTFGSGGHTTTPVVVMAKGPGEGRFAGLHLNTHVGKVLREYMQR